VRTRAPAKLTRSLRIVGRRPDGYHLIDAEMITVDLADDLEFTEGDGLEVVSGGVDVGSVPSGDDNLIRRALAAVGRTAHVRVTKRIPAGAGLGGGSADAAAVLRWAGCRDLAVAAGVGADVPFCLVGGRARVRGIGEVVEPRPAIDAVYTLLVPDVACSTAQVYRAWDELGGRPGDGPNDLEAAAITVVPELAVWRDRLAAGTGRVPMLAGSGSTWFVEGDHPGDGRIVVRTATPEALNEGGS
jgi:4-diphosphocytidyl-2-C-methyl-D-erythritol kinase